MAVSCPGGGVDGAPTFYVSGRRLPGWLEPKTLPAVFRGGQATFGNSSGGARPLQGALADVRLYDTLLTPGVHPRKELLTQILGRRSGSLLAQPRQCLRHFIHTARRIHQAKALEEGRIIHSLQALTPTGYEQKKMEMVSQDTEGDALNAAKAQIAIQQLAELLLRRTIWGKLIGDVPAATAILDRFLHHAQIIRITGNSYRLKDRPTTSTKPKPSKPSISTAGNSTTKTLANSANIP